MISFACAFVAFLLFSEHIRVAASEFHSNISINLFPMAKTLDNLRKFINVIRHNTVIATLNKIWVITYWVKEKK